MVSWEGSVNVNSVVWCFGAPFDSDSSMVWCQTEVGQKAVESPHVQHTVIPPHLFLPQDLHRRPESREMCDNCRWHFAVRFTDTPIHDTNNTLRHDIAAPDDADAEQEDGNDTDMVPNSDSDANGYPNSRMGLGAGFENVHSDSANVTDYGNGADSDRSSERLVGPAFDDGKIDSESLGAENVGRATNEGANSLSDVDSAAIVLDSENGASFAEAEESVDSNTDSVGSERVLDGVEHGIGRLVWNQCQYTTDGKAPLPDVKMGEAVTGESVTLTIQSTCSKSHDHGRPLLAQVTYFTPPRSNCSEDVEAKNVSLAIHNDGAMRRQLRLTDLRRGHNYTLCVRLRSGKSWGPWHRELLYYTPLDDSDHLVAILVSGLAVFLLVLLAYSIHRCRRNLRDKCKRFSKLDFTMKEEHLNSNGAAHFSALHQNSVVCEIPLSFKPAFTHVIPPQRGSLSFKDSAFEEDSDRRDSDPEWKDTTQVTSDPTARTSLLKKEMTCKDNGDEKDHLLGAAGDTSAETEMGLCPGQGSDMLRPKSLGLGEILPSPSVKKNVQTNPKGSKPDNCFPPDEYVTANLLCRQSCGEAEHPESVDGKGGKSFQYSDSVEPPTPTEESKEESDPHPDPDNLYIKIDSPLNPFAEIPSPNCEDSPSVQNAHCDCSGAESKTAGSGEQLRSPNGTCKFICSYGQQAHHRCDNHTSGFPQSDSCLTRHLTDLSDISHSSTEETTSRGDCYVPLLTAVEELAEDISCDPEEPGLKTHVSYLPLEKALEEIPHIPQDQTGKQDISYIPLKQALTENVP